MANGPAAASQEGRLLKITTPLGADVLLLQSIELVEEISRLSRAECVVLHDERSDLGGAPTLLDVQKILGQTVTIQFEIEDGTIRHYHGMVNSCTQMDRRTRYTSYKLEVVPSIWLLTQNQESRIFQNVTVQEVMEQILGEAFFVEYQLNSVEWKKRNYVVQYRESDFDFISRLMEEEGIFYYFTHAEEVHTMIVCVDSQSHQPCPSKAELPYQTQVEEGEFKARVTDLVIDYKLQTGKVTLWDYTFEKPKSNFAMSQPSRFKFGDNDQAEHYLFPAGSARKHDVIDASNGERGEELQNISDDIKRNAEFMQQGIDSRHKVIKAVSNCCSFTAGHKFKLTTHPTQNMVGNYVITKVSHRAVQSPVYNASLPDGGYENAFECIPWGESSNGEKAVPFRPERITPKPMILTSQTATVVGKAGEEIYTDKYGRVKVQFNWDRDGKSDEGSSCWVRVAQLWAGNRWGSMFIPRIGMEVVVHFLEGDPDQPIITGCVYNQDAMPPYELPDNKTRSGIKSDSSKGGEGFNEWRFEDKKGEEQIFMHGEYDMDLRIKNDRREWTGNEQHLIVKADHFEKVSGAHHLTIEGDQMEKINGGHHQKIGGDEAIAITGTQTVKIDGSQGIKVGSDYSHEATGAILLKGMNVVVEAMTQLTLKVGGNFVDINSAGVFIKGSMVMINSGGAPGSAMAVSPCPPTAPKDPEEADDDKPGRKMELLQRSQERKKKRPKYDPRKKSWIKLKLVDEEGKPVPGEAFEIKTSDGKYRSGSLNNKGQALISGIEQGSCEVTFPRLDKDAWEDA